jgi:protein SCO1/2
MNNSKPQSMKFLTILFCSILITSAVYSQRYFGAGADSVPEVGIIEHLGDTIPLDIKFANEKNDTVTLRSLINKPTVFSFVYFDCPGICSPLLDGVSRVIEETDLELGKDYQVITISFNYNDNTDRAKEKKENFLRKHSRNHSNNWIYLTGDSTNIYKIVDAVGFKFKRVGVDYIHAASIMVVSPQGKITRYLYGLSFLPFDFKMAILESQKGLARPSIHKVLEFCFSYDPAGRRYSLDILKVTGTLILFFLLIFGTFLFIKSRKKPKT